MGPGQLANKHIPIGLQSNLDFTMIPFEALLPYGVMMGCFMLAGSGMSAVHFLRNENKRDRWNVDAFDRALMERDLRLTGTPRGQSDAPVAPKYFALNSVWNLERAAP